MPAPLGMLLAAAAALLLMGSEKKKPATGGTTPTTPPGTPKPSTTDLPAGCELDATLPPSWRDMVTTLATTSVTADKALAWADSLDQAADKLAAGGYPKAAACLKMRASDLRKMVPAQTITPSLPNVAPPPVPGAPLAVNPDVNPLSLPAQVDANMPFTIRQGDRPFGLALYYTGNGARFLELSSTNGNLGPLVTKNGVTNYQNWAPGLVIAIPAAWHPSAKPMPPTGL